MVSVSRGADVLVSALANAGVKTIFALSGNQIMSIFDACIDADIDIVHTRHEAAAVYMAEAYAQISGSVGVALVTAGAGVGNAAGALFSASESDTPLLLISGDSPTDLDGRGAFQELDQIAITSAVTRWSHRVMSGDLLGQDLANAIMLAQSPHPGPVHLAFPVDVLKQGCSDNIPHMAATVSVSDVSVVDRVGQAIADAERPLILTGPSLNPTRQSALVQRLQQVFSVPVVSMESPRGLNDPSLGNFKAVIGDADVIVSLGKRIDFSVGFVDGISADWYGVFATQAAAEQALRNLHKQLKHHVVEDPVAFSRKLADHSLERKDRRHWSMGVQHALQQRVAMNYTGTGISPIELLPEVQKAIDKCSNPVLVCDGGEFGQWAQAGLVAPRRVINGLSGSIGGGICYGIGAACALTQSTVFVLTGDGSVGFHLAEIETAIRNSVSLVIVVGNDSRWNAEHQLQIREYGSERLVACDLSKISYHDACIALGGNGRRVSTVTELRAAFDEITADMLCLDVALESLPAPTFKA